MVDDLDAALDALIAAENPWPALDALVARWDDRLAGACRRSLEATTATGRQRILWLVARVAAPSAHAVLLARLPRAHERELGQILRALTAAGVVAPTAEIARALDEVPEDGCAAAALAKDPALIPQLVAQLAGDRPRWQAALALAWAGRREHVDTLLACLTTPDDLDASGFVVALETMADPRAVPQLRALLTGPGAPVPWDLGHALFRLTGREPLVELQDGPDAVAIAWRGYDLDAPPRPRLQGIELEAGGARATFAIVDGAGAIGIDYDPPILGSSWPRWSLSLWARGQALYGIGSRCDTCETTLRATGSDPSIAASTAAEVRACLRDLTALDEAALAALTPCLLRLRTGHYLAAVVDLELEDVRTAERSWLSRRALHRGDDAQDLHDWPGAAHFQVRDAVPGEVASYGVILPTQPLATLDEATIAAHAAAIAAGAHPTALAMAWVESKHVELAHAERFLIGAVLDGHHRLAAYARMGRPARILLVCRVEDSWGPREDRTRWLREAIGALAATSHP